MIKRIIAFIILVLMILSNSVAAADDSAVYTTSFIDKYTLRVEIFPKQPLMGKKMEITSYSILHGTKTVKIFYKETEVAGKNQIDINLRGISNPNPINPVRVILYNVQKDNYSPFKDINGLESEIYIRHLHDAGLINGYDDGTFRPNSTISRAEFFTMMVRALGYLPVQSSEESFSDIENHWGKKEIMTAVKHGLVKGNGDGTIRPDDKITIGQVALIIDRAYTIKTYGQKGVYEKLPTKEHYAKESVKKMFDAGILTIHDSTYDDFNIDRPATRAECAMMISRAMVN